VISEGGEIDVPLESFEVCLAEIWPANGKPAGISGSIDVVTRRSPEHIAARFVQASSRDLSWSDPAAAAKLARVVNGRTTPTNTPDVLAVGPERSDERDRDIVEEKLGAVAVIEPRDRVSKLLVTTRFERDGIAWHHLAPYLITHVMATAGDKPLSVKTTPRKMHEQAGAWSWVLHEFDVPAGTGEVSVAVKAVHPKSVAVSVEVWHSDE
jgi:hypothetical protein